MSQNPPVDFLQLNGQEVYKKILREGKGEPNYKAGSTVAVHYEGRLENGTVFDSSLTRGDPISFQLGKGQVIKGWDVGIDTMRIGEKAELWINSELAYGKAGSGKNIPPNSPLIFGVELMSVNGETADRSVGEKILEAIVKKDEGNGSFKNGDFDGALGSYYEADSLLSGAKGDGPGQEAEIKALKISVQSNSAACHLKLKNGTAAKKACNDVLKLDAGHEKATYRLFQAMVSLGEFEQAIEYLTEKKSILKGVDVDREIAATKRAAQHETNKEKKMYQQMFK